MSHSENGEKRGHNLLEELCLNIKQTAEDSEVELNFSTNYTIKKVVWCDAVYWNHATQNRVLEKSKEILGSKEGTKYLEQPSNCDTMRKDNAASTKMSTNKISQTERPKDPTIVGC
jgi:hypothetical protein